MNAQDPAALLRNIREEVIGLLFNRYVFRTHQEIVRLNPKLQGRPRSMWDGFVRYYPDDANSARAEILKEGVLTSGWESLACRRLLGEDRKALISAAQKAVHFASKRVAHSVPDVPLLTWARNSGLSAGPTKLSSTRPESWTRLIRAGREARREIKTAQPVSRNCASSHRWISSTHMVIS